MSSAAVERLLMRLDARRSGSGWKSRCPAHDDQHASLSIAEGNEGRALLKCHAGCDLASILAMLEITESDLFNGERRGRGRIVAQYPYTDEVGNLLFEVVRFEPKDFRQRRPDGAGRSTWKTRGVRRVPYRLPNVIATAQAAGVVYVVEGEKDVEALEAIGLTATCNPGGASEDEKRPKWLEEYAKYLKGASMVVILPDNDAPGHAHAQAVARTCTSIATTIKVVDLPGLPAKGDVSDWIAASGTRAQLEALVEAAPAWRGVPLPQTVPEGATEDPDQGGGAVIVRMSSVKAEKVRWCWRNRAPFGKVVVLDGDPGLGKSSMTLDLVARGSRGWPMPGEELALEPMTGILLTAEDGLADTVRPRLEAAGADIDRVVVMTAGRDDDGQPRPPIIPDDIGALGRAIRQHGARIVVIDPLMAHLSGRIDSHRDQDVRRAMAGLADMAEATGAVVIVVRHLNKNSTGGSPIYRGGGSIGIIGAARVGLMVGRDPKDPSRCILAVSKSNLGPIPTSLAYKVIPISDDADAPIRIAWEGSTEITAHDLVQVGGDRSAVDGAGADAVAFLEDLLASGPVLTETVKRQASEAGIAWRTIERAKGRAGVRSRRKGFGGPWYLELQADHLDRQPRKDGGLWTNGGLCQRSGENPKFSPAPVAIFPIDRHAPKPSEKEVTTPTVRATEAPRAEEDPEPQGPGVRL